MTEAAAEAAAAAAAIARTSVAETDTWDNWAWRLGAGDAAAANGDCDGSIFKRGGDGGSSASKADDNAEALHDMLNAESSRCCS